eukprot:TRINITY_DN1068_c0_g1_i2.p1 TRINITY_DN1068_c0_g1~~TRINITY_DN1068_c0_g1_i2.p1  ORF type:complete len:182 (+),score=46.97 TRINITY_DN1068_c0_g1_i2:173-718(+)
MEKKKIIVNIFILCGQSNMCGRGRGEDLPLKIKNDENLNKVYFNYQNDLQFGDLAKSDGWTILKPQLNPMLKYTHFGPEMSFSMLLQDFYDKELNKEEKDEENNVTEIIENRIAIIKFACGSTNLHTNWNPENQGEKAFYQPFLNFVNKALIELEDLVNQHLSENDSVEFVRKCIIWYQGR